MTPKAAKTKTPPSLSDLLWSQWCSLGVPAAAPRSQLLIDPEALLFETATHLAEHRDDRIYDGAVSWAIKYHSLISTARIKRLHSAAEPVERTAFERLAGRVAQHTDRLTWPSDTDVTAWKPATAAALPNLASTPALLRLRSRALFGANARGEAVAFLACNRDSNGTDLATIARATDYSKRHLAGPLEHLALAGFVDRWKPTNSHRYRLSPTAREFLTNHEHQQAEPQWIDWPRRYRLLQLLANAQSELKTTGGLVAATAMLKAAKTEFTREDITQIGPLPSPEWSAEQADRIHAWIDKAASQLATGDAKT